jgi:integrase
MAVPFQKAGKWYSRFRDRHGRWRSVVMAATTKAQAVLQNSELQVREDRIRLGLDEEPKVNADQTFAEMIEWWIENRLRDTRSASRCEGTVRRHLLESHLAGLPPAAVTPGKVDDFLHTMGRSFSPATVNHLRAYIRRIFNSAMSAERFHGKNPVTRDVKKRKVPKRKPQYLLPDEVLPVLQAVPDRWRAAFALGIYAGLRKGEILGLRKEDVDLERRLIMVRRSHGADTPKGGHEEGVPIAAELMPYLEDAVDSSRSEWVIPHPNGGRHPEGTDLVSIIRTALRRSQIVSGWVHKCRRKGCGFSIETADGEQRRCPQCQMKLWPTSKVRPLRFHDTRHTTASLLMMFGANPAAVQRILRHTDIRLTVEVYGHLAPNYLRTEIDLLSFQKHDPEKPDPTPGNRPAITAASRSFASPVLQKHSENGSRRIEPKTETEEDPEDEGGRGGRIRTDDILLPKQARYQLRYTPKGEDTSTSAAAERRCQGPESGRPMRNLVLHRGVYLRHGLPQILYENQRVVAEAPCPSPDLQHPPLAAPATHDLQRAVDERGRAPVARRASLGRHALQLGQ